jgi:hypothetical protein
MDENFLRRSDDCVRYNDDDIKGAYPRLIFKAKQASFYVFMLLFHARRFLYESRPSDTISVLSAENHRHHLSGSFSLAFF